MNFSTDDLLLVKLLQTDALQAIQLIYKKYHLPLFHTAYRILSTEEEAKDVVQEVFIKFWESRLRLEISSSLQAYLHRAVINTALNHLQKNKKTFSTSLEKSYQISNPATAQPMMKEELEEAIQRAIQGLPTRCRLVFSLNRYEGLSYKEIAASLSISTKAVEKEMMKALKLLRKYLKEFLPVVLTLLLS
jgi:RNA polymerase sigma-70 factor (ECF subfamily)